MIWRTEEIRQIGSPVKALLAACLSMLIAALLFAAGPAAAAIVTDRPLLFSFDGSDSSIGGFDALGSIAVDYATSDVYAVNLAGMGNGPTGYGPEPGEWDDERVVCKFDAEGNAGEFAAGGSAGRSCLDGKDTPGGAFGVEGLLGTFALTADLAVDNSGGSGSPGEGEQGRLYVSEEGGPVHAFAPSGAYLWTLPRTAAQPCGIAVDPQGHLWILDRSTVPPHALEFDNMGSPPPQIDSVPLTVGSPCRLDLDQGGALYAASAGLPFPQGSVEKYVGGEWDSTISADPPRDIAVDQSEPAGHLFVSHGGQTSFPARFVERDPSGTALGSFGGDLLVAAGGIAYSPAEKRVYQAEPDLSGIRNLVEVFGPETTGTVPDVTAQPTTEIGQNKARANATINPQGVPNSYRFEWAEGGEEVQHLKIVASSGTFKIETKCCPKEVTGPLPFDADAAAIQGELEGLGWIGSGNVTVDGTPTEVDPDAPSGNIPGEFDFTFTGALAGVDVVTLKSVGIDLGGASPHTPLSTTAPGPVWATAQSSPAQSVGVDGEDHAVSFSMTRLGANTTYSVRLAGTNTGNSLSAYSTPDIFKTPIPPRPTVGGCSSSAVTTESAKVTCTVDPQEDVTVWQVLKSARSEATQAECEALPESAFTKVEEGTIPTEEPATVPIEAELEGLSPAQTYCIRVIAANGNPEAGVADLPPFQTLAIPPSEASPAFAAPRTDTTARINARVNPEGEADLTYRFELSEDGANWVERPIRTSAVNAREQIVVAEELAGLRPNTTYLYRLAKAENLAGPVPGLPVAARSFTTRTAAETALPPNAYPGEAGARGIELVSSPDKGNQNLLPYAPYGTGEPISPDGERALWLVAGGAPGAPNGSKSSFLAKRTAAGWRNESLNPPAEEQFGDGNLLYTPEAATPDLSSVVLSVEYSTGFASPPPPSGFARTRLGGERDLLDTYDALLLGHSFVDLSDDGEHVLVVNPETRQLEDVGEPGRPVVVSAMPDGSQPACGLSMDGESFGAEGLWRHDYHGIATTDASRAYFRVRPEGECGGSGEPAGLYGLYVRNREAEKTTLIDPGTAGSSPEFIRTTPDGRAAYFVTESACREWSQGSSPPACEAAEEKDVNGHRDVYRWDEEAGPEGEAGCLTCADPGVPDANLVMSVMVSDDFSRLYFLSEEQLVPGLGKRGARNLYVLSGGKIRFVAGGLHDGQAFGDVLRKRAAELSADGNVLLFRTQTNPGLTVDAMAAQCTVPGSQKPAKCEQLYLYDDRDRSLECLSCRRSATTTVSVGSPGRSEYSFRLSADGSTAAFATQQALIEEDVNRDTDIYEWRNGVLRMLTDGVSDVSSQFLTTPQVAGVDADGSDIVFTLVPPEGSLTGFEHDKLLNLYDARIGGGFEPPNPPAHCDGDSCQGPLVPEPPSRQAASAGFRGHGNLAERPNCRRFARRARRLSARAKRLRRAAHRAKRKGQARRQRARADVLAKRARLLSRRAGRCRARARATRGGAGR